ncbi:elongation factor P [Candidatus Uhrbacteria bacterium]|nr:elongation factor P [Candidatus Uhrbacteria bacterium]
MATTQDIAKGIALVHKGDIHVVTDFQFVNPGKGAAFVRTRLKNVKTGKVVEETFKSGEAIDLVELDRVRMQYLYTDQASHVFMDPKTYEQVSMPRAEVGDAGAYLKEGEEVALLMHDGAPVTLELPRKMTLKITTAPPGVKGDTASGRVTKEATLENGIKLQVPLFVNEGDLVVVNTETGEYVERA